MSRKPNKLGPLRLVVDYYSDPKTGSQMERLECGHVIHRKQDIYGYTSATRRRCRHCKE